MITLWGIWHCTDNRWLGGLPSPWLYTDQKDAETIIAKMQDGGADYVSCLVARLYGQFVLVPPEVVAAVKAIGGGPVVIMQPHQESVHRILNWIAQAVGSES